MTNEPTAKNDTDPRTDSDQLVTDESPIATSVLGPAPGMTAGIPQSTGGPDAV